jgi:hypothetical protein
MLPLASSGVVLVKKATVAFAVFLLGTSGPLFAHHSESINDQDRLVTIKGKVSRFAFTAPHVQIYLDAKSDQGEEASAPWIATGGNPSSMRRSGWNMKTLEPGEEITITGFPYKDGRKILFWLRILRANGEELPTADGLQGRLDRFLATHPHQKLDPPSKPAAAN